MNRWRWISPLTFALAGLLFVASARSSAGFDFRSGDDGDLISLIHDQDQRSAKLTRNVSKLSTQVQSRLAAQVGDAAQILKFQSSRFSSAAGEYAITGPGIVVTLKDAPPPLGEVPQGLTLDDFVVHQQDVLAVINALWSGHAEAIGINGERISNVSSIRCAGNTLLLNGRLFSPPFKISAIGPVATLRKSVESNAAIGIYRQYADVVGLGWEVRSGNNIKLPKANLLSALRFASLAL